MAGQKPEIPPGHDMIGLAVWYTMIARNMSYSDIRDRHSSSRSNMLETLPTYSQEDTAGGLVSHHVKRPCRSALFCIYRLGSTLLSIGAETPDNIYVVDSKW